MCKSAAADSPAISDRRLMAPAPVAPVAAARGSPGGAAPLRNARMRPPSALPLVELSPWARPQVAERAPASHSARKTQARPARTS